MPKVIQADQWGVLRFVPVSSGPHVPLAWSQRFTGGLESGLGVPEGEGSATESHSPAAKVQNTLCRKVQPA